MDVARLNFSHGTVEEHAETARMVRDAANAAGRPVAILQDLPGPKLRIGRVVDDRVELETGSTVTFVCHEDGLGDARQIPVAVPELAHAVDPGEIVYLADGSVRLRVTDVREGERRVRLRGRVRRGRRVAPGAQHPGRDGDPPLGPRRRPGAAARRASDIGVDLVALSFVRRAEDVESVRRHTRLPLIAKIEKPQAVERMESILRASDCVMVARGDLGIELPIQDVPHRAEAAPRASPARWRGRRSPRRRCSTRWSPPRGRRAPRSPTSPTRSSTAPTR